jgi:cyclase
MKKALVTAIVLSVATVVSAVHADKHSSATFKTTKINANLTLLQGKGGNITLSKGKDGLLIVDDDYAEMSAPLKKEIEKHGGFDKLKFVLNTHWHGDHTGNNANLGDNVNIVAHDNVRKRLSSRQEIPIFKKVSEPYPAHGLPNLTYPQSMTIHFNNDTLILEHYPNGHTDGDSVIFFTKSNVVSMGDHMFYPMFPFVDIATGGNAISYAENVGRILKKVDNNTVVIPGHGPLTDKKGLTRFHQMLTGTITEVSAMKSSGMTLKQIQEKGLSKKWNEWTGGFINAPTWILFIFESL